MNKIFRTTLGKKNGEEYIEINMGFGIKQT